MILICNFGSYSAFVSLSVFAFMSLPDSNRHVSFSLISCLLSLLLFTDHWYDLSKGVVKTTCHQSIRFRFKRRLRGQASSQKILGLCFLRIVAIYLSDRTVSQAACHCSLALLVLSKRTNYASWHHWLNPSELSPVWCSRRRVPRWKWTSRAINIDPTNVAQHRRKFVPTPLILLTKGA
jgi:hypothetical protein